MVVARRDLLKRAYWRTRLPDDFAVVIRVVAPAGYVTALFDDTGVVVTRGRLNNIPLTGLANATLIVSDMGTRSRTVTLIVGADIAISRASGPKST